MKDHFKLSRWKSVKCDNDHWYSAIELLGTGGNAATFLAYSTTAPRKGQLVAIKVFRRLSKPERKQTFLAETEFLKTCNHPAILRIYDQGTYYDNNPFLVAEYLPSTLRTAMRRKIPMIEKIVYAMHLLSALDYLNTLDVPVVHRDVKPENIFLRGGSCVLGDFGLMKRLDGQFEQDREILKESVGPGMPWFYRSPDLVAYLNGELELTTKSDVFQLGLVLAELFTGRNPFRPTANFTDPIELEPLRAIHGRMRDEMSRLISRMLVFNPAKRPTARQLLNGWERVFREVVSDLHNIEGRAIS